MVALLVAAAVLRSCSASVSPVAAPQSEVEVVREARIEFASLPDRCWDAELTGSGVVAVDCELSAGRFLVPAPGSSGHIRPSRRPGLCLSAEGGGRLAARPCAETPKDGALWTVGAQRAGDVAFRLAADTSRCVALSRRNGLRSTSGRLTLAACSSQDGEASSDVLFALRLDVADEQTQRRLQGSPSIHIHASVAVPEGHDPQEYQGNEGELGQVVADHIASTNGLQDIATGEIHVHNGNAEYTQHPTAAPPTAAPPTPAPTPSTPPPTPPTDSTSPLPKDCIWVDGVVYHDNWGNSFKISQQGCEVTFTYENEEKQGTLHQNKLKVDGWSVGTLARVGGDEGLAHFTDEGWWKEGTTTELVETPAPTPAPSPEPTEASTAAPTEAPSTTAEPTTAAAKTTAPEATTVKEVTDAVASEDTTATTTTAVKKTVEVGFTLSNLDHSALQSDKQARDDLEKIVKESVAEEAAAPTCAEDVTVTLSPGSVRVSASIEPREGQDPVALNDKLAASNTLVPKVLQRLSESTSIMSISTGDVSASDSSVSTATAEPEEANPMMAQTQKSFEWLGHLGLLPWIVIVILGGSVFALRSIVPGTRRREQSELMRNMRLSLGEDPLGGATFDMSAGLSHVTLDQDSPSAASGRGQIVPLINSSDDEHIHAVVVPGGGMNKEGLPPLWVQARLQRAKELYEQILADPDRPPGRRRPYIITLSAGSQHKSVANSSRVGKKPDEVFESEANAQFLIRELGVPASDVLEETMSHDTVGNAFFLRTMHSDVAGLRNMIVTTSRYHMPRTRAIFEKVFSLPPFPPGFEGGYRLWFEEAPDAGIPPELLFTRCEREAGSLEQFQRISANWSTLTDLHCFIYRSSGAFVSKKDKGRVSARDRSPSQNGVAPIPEQNAEYGGGSHCHNCGAWMAGDWQFCNQCGARRQEGNDVSGMWSRRSGGPNMSPVNSSRSAGRQLSSRTAYSYVSGQAMSYSGSYNGYNSGQEDAPDGSRPSSRMPSRSPGR